MRERKGTWAGGLPRPPCTGLLLLLAAVACTQAERLLPEASDVEAYYQTEYRLSARMNGNVAEITVWQSPDQLRRGGSLWARVGPYVFLFTPATRDLFADWGGLAGVRVVTMGPGDVEVARALLPRDALNDLTWRRSLNIAGRARLEGTERVSLLEQLVLWGERHTTFEYNPRYVPER